MSTPSVKGPFTATRYRHAIDPGILYEVSLNPEEHKEYSVLCRRVRDGHFLYVARVNLVPPSSEEGVPYLYKNSNDQQSDS